MNVGMHLVVCTGCLLESRNEICREIALMYAKVCSFAFSLTTYDEREIDTIAIHGSRLRISCQRPEETAIQAKGPPPMTSQLR